MTAPSASAPFGEGWVFIVVVLTTAAATFGASWEGAALGSAALGGCSLTTEDGAEAPNASLSARGALAIADLVGAGSSRGGFG